MLSDRSVTISNHTRVLPLTFKRSLAARSVEESAARYVISRRLAIPQGSFSLKRSCSVILCSFKGEVYGFYTTIAWPFPNTVGFPKWYWMWGLCKMCIIMQSKGIFLSHFAINRYTANIYTIVQMFGVSKVF